MPDAPALISDHQPVVTTPVGPQGGPTYAHRGATITSNDKGTLFNLTLDGLPATPWRGLDNLDLAVKLVDPWQDHGRLPAPYRQKA